MNRLQLIGLALLSGCSLFLEITLTRLLSTLYFPPYVFAVISLAILGIGIGAAIASWRENLRSDIYLPLYTLLTGLSTLVVISFAILTASEDLQIILFVLIAIPYVLVGLILSTIFSIWPQRSSQLYMADLVGAGIGAVAAIPILNTLGAINGGLLAAAIFGVCALLFQPISARRQLGYLSVAIIFLGSNLASGWLEPDLSSLHTDKPITDSLADGGEILETRWDAFTRTDLVQPGNGEAYRIYVDGGAGSVMPPATNSEFLIGDIGFFPFATAQPDHVMVIGPGGGLDVWFGLQVGAEEIVAVEVNRASVELVKEYADYNGGLYDHPSVRVIIDEGRSTLRREDAQYDLIFLSQVITSIAERSGYALTENALYTVEAFGEYLDHLRPGGQIALKLYDEITLSRALSVALAALNERGLSDSEALGHIAAFIDPDNNPSIPLLLVRDQPYTRNEALADAAVANDVGFVPLFLPGVLAQPPLDELEAGEIDYETVVEDAESNIFAPTDDRPFFFQFERGLPKDLLRLWIVLGVVVALGAVVLVTVQRRVDNAVFRWSPLYFAGLGIGFITIEIVMIQQTRLFLGHPTLGITTVLATVLVGGGIGSWLSNDWKSSQPDHIPLWPPALVIAFVLVWTIGWSVLSDQLLQAALFARLLVTIISILPVAAVMGMPFPLGLKAVGENNRQVAISWAVNGVTTVIGSVGAITLAIVAGFDVALFMSVAAYGLALISVLIGRFRGS